MKKYFNILFLTIASTTIMLNAGKENKIPQKNYKKNISYANSNANKLTPPNNQRVIKEIIRSANDAPKKIIRLVGISISKNNRLQGTPTKNAEQDKLDYASTPRKLFQENEEYEENVTNSTSNLRKFNEDDYDKNNDEDPDNNNNDDSFPNSLNEITVDGN